ncbi:lysozyme inhibitor LprI family protein [Gymnodinialimonas ceratoperidinii]|uniref:DUF1311 domain-containing protein n=1 Tax=Gymnodinialimonas ceratoperidinii TaxID=2856823 RepID=A0A8F6Y9R2_9RHOB|nr:lysozyme inhibitor LprI family protein [Gymnodinialimonas ceratoperidinii]QXT38813.1 DUF1311 domain-containing protein [Gymnodinialimonas ceratoperidinii]
MQGTGDRGRFNAAGFVVSVSLAVSVAGAASAQDWDCEALESLPQQGINQCLAEQHAFWDRILNNAYQQVIAERDGEDEERLRVAQRAWMTYRDATCDMEADAMRGGSGEAMLHWGCMARLTERRARDLETYLRR